MDSSIMLNVHIGLTYRLPGKEGRFSHGVNNCSRTSAHGSFPTCLQPGCDWATHYSVSVPSTAHWRLHHVWPKMACCDVHCPADLRRPSTLLTAPHPKLDPGPRPSRKMKSFFWDKLPENRLQQTFWADHAPSYASLKTDEVWACHYFRPLVYCSWRTY